MDREQFYIIMLHYNQPQYVIGALDSVIAQNYENIEFIFADDASRQVDLDLIKAYIEKNKGENIKNVQYIINESNMGTVKTVNRAVKAARGKYLLFFAADDALYDKNVISNFVDAFARADQNDYMISSQCHMMDALMEKELHCFVSPSVGKAFNEFSSFDQYCVFCEECFLAIGATAMRREMFEKFGFFDEEYKYVEDWSYFLRLTRMGGHVKYEDFDGLLHRDGGISHTKETKKIPPHVLGYKFDIVRIFEKEILPYTKQMDSKTRSLLVARYVDEKRAYHACGGTQKGMNSLAFFALFPSYCVQRLFFPLTRNWEWMCRMGRAAATLSLICIGLLFLSEHFKQYGISLAIWIFTYVFAAIFVLAALATVGIFFLRCGVLFLKKCKKLFSRKER